MYFLIDGYNVLFSCREEDSPLETGRLQLVEWMQRAFKRARLSGTIVFDGAHRRGEESGRSYPSPLEIAFAPRGQSADEYILEQIESKKDRALLTVVTNDKHLQRHARALGAKTMSNRALLLWLANKKKSGKHAGERRDSPQREEELLRVFEERLRGELEGDGGGVK